MNHADRLIDLLVDILLGLTSEGGEALMAEADKGVSHLFLGPALENIPTHNFVDRRVERVVSG